MTSDALPRPVVALDVDGVLNIDPAEHTVTHHLRIAAQDVPDSPFVPTPGQDLALTVHLDPSVGPWITALRAHADVVWATTWEHAANTYLAPLLGIDPLPVAISTTTHPPRFGYAKNGDTTGWKAAALTEYAAGRALVWVDDLAWAYTHGDFRAPRYAARSKWEITDDDEEQAPVSLGTLVLAPDPATGLDTGLRAQVEAFVAAHTPGAPMGPR